MKHLIAGCLLILGGCASSTDGSTSSNEHSSVLSKAQFAHDEVIGYQILDSRGTAIGRSRTIYRVNGQGRVKVRTRLQYNDITREFSWVIARDGRVSHFKRLCSKDGLKSFQWKSGVMLVSDGASVTEKESAGEVPLPMTSDTPFALNLLVQKLNLEVGSSISSRYFDPARLKQVPLQLTVYATAQGELQVSTPLGTASFDPTGRIHRLQSSDGRSFIRMDDVEAIPAVVVNKKLAYRPPELPSWKDERVKINSRRGVLSIPRNLARWTRLKAPVVFIFSDQGIQDRYGISGEIDHGTWQVQDYLLEAGYAVLRLDDEGARQTGEPVAEILRFLKSQTSVDAERIILLGHGSGIRPALEGALHSPAVVRGLGFFGGDWRSIPASLREKAKKLTTPVAIFQGLKDIEVSWKTDTKDLTDFFKTRPKGGKSTFSKYYSRVDHLMKSESKTSSRDRYKDASRRVERDFLRDLLKWLDSLS